MIKLVITILKFIIKHDNSKHKIVIQAKTKNKNKHITTKTKKTQKNKCKHQKMIVRPRKNKKK